MNIVNDSSMKNFLFKVLARFLKALHKFTFLAFLANMYEIVTMISFVLLMSGENFLGSQLLDSISKSLMYVHVI